MNSGSMIIPNYIKDKTVLLVDNNKAIAVPDYNALNDARAALSRESGSPSKNSGNIKFLTYWINLYSRQKREAQEKANQITAKVQSK
jgi:hypothetical protein